MRPLNNSFMASIGTFYFVHLFFKLCWVVVSVLSRIIVLPPRKVVVKIEADESADKLDKAPKFDVKKLTGDQKTVFMWDPSTMDYLGETPAMNAAEVKASILQRGGHLRASGESLFRCFCCEAFLT